MRLAVVLVIKPPVLFAPEDAPERTLVMVVTMLDPLVVIVDRKVVGAGVSVPLLVLLRIEELFDVGVTAPAVDELAEIAPPS